MNEPRVVESVTNECQSLGRAHESSSARAEQLIACLEGEIAKRDARIVELEARIVWLECESQVSAAPVSEAKAQGVEQVQWHVRYLQAETVSDGWWQDSSEQRAAWCAEANQQQHAKGLPDTWEIRRFTIAAPVQQPKCKTCDDNGLIGGPSFYAPDEGGEPCPDCSAPVQQVSVPDGFVLAKETVVEMPDGSKVLGYTTIGRVGIFNSAEEVFDAIRELDLPLGWVSMTTEQLLPGWMLAAAPAAPAADAWIPVSERLPNIAQEVIVHSEFDGVCAGVLDSYGEWFAPCSEYKLIRVTSWMPMPTKIEANRHDQ